MSERVTNSLDDERPWDGRRVDPFLLLVKNLERLYTRFLPEDGEALEEFSTSLGQ